ncbi:MAG TPA: PBS lyase, partial [Nostoc sp. UBA8866]|nr:PBS lyase [Nostoc sp. UBA8866]
MVTTLRHHRQPSRYILYSLAFILSFLLCLPWVSAKEQPKPQPTAWQINGIVAALDDGYNEVKRYALSKLVEYDLQKLKSVGQKPEDIAKKTAQILKDKSVDSSVRSDAAVALGNLEEAAKPYLKDILDFLKDKSVDSSVRSGAAVALANLGE